MSENTIREILLIVMFSGVFIGLGVIVWDVLRYANKSGPKKRSGRRSRRR